MKISVKYIFILNLVLVFLFVSNAFCASQTLSKIASRFITKSASGLSSSRASTQRLLNRALPLAAELSSTPLLFGHEGMIAGKTMIPPSGELNSLFRQLNLGFESLHDKEIEYAELLLLAAEEFRGVLEGEMHQGDIRLLHAYVSLLSASFYVPKHILKNAHTNYLPGNIPIQIVRESLVLFDLITDHYSHEFPDELFNSKLKILNDNLQRLFASAIEKNIKDNSTQGTLIKMARALDDTIVLAYSQSLLSSDTEESLTFVFFEVVPLARKLMKRIGYTDSVFLRSTDEIKAILEYGRVIYHDTDIYIRAKVSPYSNGPKPIQPIKPRKF